VSFLKKLSIILFLISVLFFSQPFSLFAQNGETEILYLQDSVICKDFDINYEKTSQSTSPAELTPETGQVQGIQQAPKPFRGTIRLNSQNFPDLSQMEKTLSRSLKKLLPQKLKQTLPVEQPIELKNQAKHYIIGEGEEENEIGERSIPENQTTLPPWWPNLLRGTKITCGLLGSCQAPKSMAVEIKQVNSVAPPPGISCSTGQNLKNKPIEVIAINSGEFSVISTWERAVKIFFGWIGKIWSKITKTEESAKFIAKTRENLPGGQTLNSQRPFKPFIPHALIPANRNGPLTAQANIVASGENIIGGSNDIAYQNLAATHREYCLGLCSQTPNNIDVSSIDPLCPSCNADDYPLTTADTGGLDDIPLDMALCQRDSSGACNYYDPNATQGCGPGQDPVCEGGKCNPYEYGQAKDYEKCGGAPYKNINPECNAPSVCYPVNFAPNPNGGYGYCQYTNQTVCVRADRASTGSCAAICNWACCAYQ